MKRVDIYTTPMCGYCHMAKRLLKKKGVAFNEINVMGDGAARARMVERAPNARTVPQIFIGEIHVGGSDELYELEFDGELDALLGRMKAALVQLTSSDDPAANLPVTEALIREAAAAGAAIALTPEVTNIVSASRTRQTEVLRHQADDPTLTRLRAVAAQTGIWISLGSLALLSDDPDGRFVNRQFLIDGTGAIVASYDKIHMFDVELGGDESYRELKGYRPGERAVVAATPWGPIGLTTCYDMRFPALYRALAEAGAVILTVPSAFTVPTGRAHWEVLLRARAIETGSFVLAAAQWGTHAATRGRVRQTYGHSLAVDPWGAVIADAGEGTGVTLVEIDTAQAAEARAKIPALANARAFAGP